MASEKLRREIAFEAARLMYVRQESEYFRAKIKAARRICQGWIKPADLPTNREILDQIHAFARIHEPDRRTTAAREVGSEAHQLDRFQVYQFLLLPLEGVKQNPLYHPEGDVLYHSLQVFDLARDALPYDEEFLLSALLHDVGKAIDPRDHVQAALESLQGTITPRTTWLIEHHMEAAALADGTIGARARRRLEASENFDELVLLCDCDRAGRQKGVEAPDLEEALDYVRELSQACE